MPYAAWQQTFDPGVPHGDHYYWTRSQFDVLDDALTDSLVPLAATPRDPLCEVHVHHLGGAVAGIADDATAFSHRGVSFFVNLIGHAGAGERFPAVREWVRGSREALASHARTGSQPNFTSDFSDLKLRSRDFAAGARLQALHEHYDPEGLLAPVRQVSGNAPRRAVHSEDVRNHPHA